MNYSNTHKKALWLEMESGGEMVIDEMGEREKGQAAGPCKQCGFHGKSWLGVGE